LIYIVGAPYQLVSKSARVLIKEYKLMLVHCMICDVCNGLASHWDYQPVPTTDPVNYTVPEPQLIELVRCQTTQERYHLVIGVQCFCGIGCDRCTLVYRVVPDAARAYAIYHQTLLWQQLRQAKWRQPLKVRAA